MTCVTSVVPIASALLKRVGAASVDVVDLNPERLATARQLGVSAAAASADELDRPRGWDLVIDATGNAQAIQDGLGRVGKGGTFLQFGVSDYVARATIEPYRIYNQEITITGSMAVLHSYERAAALFAGGVIDPRGVHLRPVAACRLRRRVAAVRRRRRT